MKILPFRAKKLFIINISFFSVFLFPYLHFQVKKTYKLIIYDCATKIQCFFAEKK